MNKFVKGVAAAAVAATALVGMTAPAQAQRWHGGGYHHDWDRGYRGDWHRGGNAGAAVAAGILGLGIGAAIASADQPYYGGYNYGYYAPPPPVYYTPAPAYGYYGNSYYGGYYGGGYDYPW